MKPMYLKCDIKTKYCFQKILNCKDCIFFFQSVPDLWILFVRPFSDAQTLKQRCPCGSWQGELHCGKAEVGGGARRRGADRRRPSRTRLLRSATGERHLLVDNISQYYCDRD